MTFDQHPEGMDRDEMAALWCMSLAEGPLTASERADFEAWIADPENAVAMQLQAGAWNLVAFSAGKPEIVRMRREALDDYHRSNRRRWSGHELGISRRWGMGIAATVLVGALSVATWQSDLFSSPSPALAEYRTDRGERRVALLDDGSRLSLDAASEVDVRMSDERRALTLVDGRAGFTVAKAKTPFTVAAGDKMVVATGTRFSVERLTDQVHIILYEGSVRILSRDSVGEHQIAVMSPGEMLALPAFGRPARLTIEKGRESMQAWEGGQLEFVDEPLDSAVARVNRYARKPISIADDVPTGLRITGIFNASDAAGFAQGVAALNGLRVTDSSEGLVLGQ